MARKKHTQVWTEERWPTVNPHQPTRGGTPPETGKAVKRFRVEIERRTDALHEARFQVERELGLANAERIEDWTPMVTFKAIFKGKGDKRRLVEFRSLITPEQRDEIREAVHPFAFTAEQVRNA